MKFDVRSTSHRLSGLCRPSIWGRDHPPPIGATRQAVLDLCLPTLPQPVDLPACANETTTETGGT
jgi:hypothetical protein